MSEVRERDKELKDQANKEAEEKRILQEKKRNYARNVKEMYKPKISQRKRQELEE